MRTRSTSTAPGPVSRRPATRWGSIVFLACAFLLRPSLAPGFEPSFESPPVHPLEMSPDGTALFALQTDDHRLAVFDLTAGPLPLLALEMPVGIEPVTVRARTDTEIWVVNHVSDSISILDIDPDLGSGTVRRTLLVGNEPTDVVFAGDPERAFVCLSQEESIRVYDPEDLDAAPVTIPVGANDPRALAVSPDGNTVYVCALHSGNRTTVVPYEGVEAGGGPPPPNPPMDPDLPPAPRVALIVRHDGSNWVDETLTSWDAHIPYEIEDRDLIEISSSSLTIVDVHGGLGTSLFNIAVHPVSGRIYVSNQEAFNDVRFEPNLRGRFLQNRVTTVEAGGANVTPRHLNEQIDYDIPSGNETERAASLSTPLDLVASGDGNEIYVAAFGSSKIGVLDTDGGVTRRIDVGSGPAGLALDEPRGVLYVLHRIDNSLGIVDLADDQMIEIPMPFDPVSPERRAGQRTFYDAAGTSAHGDLACASCHLFADMDHLAWDLGDPEGEFVTNTFNGIHPMKGPMVTQSLKGLESTPPFHWRGDRADLEAFNPTFVSLMGRATEIAPSDFDDLEAFLLALRYPPAPGRNLDGSLPDPPVGPNAVRGEDLFIDGHLVGQSNCVSCHELPTGGDPLIIPAPLIQDDQDMIVPQLRNLYEKTRFERGATSNVRGFGLTHDGADGGLFDYLHFSFFTFDNDDQRRDVEAFLLAFDSGTHAAVGAQWTMDGTNEAEGEDRLTTLTNTAGGPLLGLIAKGRDLSGELRGWSFVGGADFISDRASEGTWTLSALLDLAREGTEITFTGVPAGCEIRLGVDRDGDGYRDRDEIDAGSDPADPNSIPDVTDAIDSVSARPTLVLEQIAPIPARTTSRIRYRIPAAGAVSLQVFDVRGRRVRSLVDRRDHPAGSFETEWNLRSDDGGRVSRGAYFVRLRLAGERVSRRIVVGP